MKAVLFAAASGVATSLAFPSWLTPGFRPWTGWAAWVALAPLFAAIAGVSPRRAALAGWIAGTAFFASALSWILAIKELDVYRPAAWLALSAALGTFWAAWAALVAAAGPRRGLLLAPGLWWAAELARGWIATGFPWAELGASQAGVPAVFLGARTFGVHAVSGAVVAMNGLWWSLARAGSSRRAAAVSAAVWVAVLAAAARLERPAAAGPSLRVAALQGSFTEEEKWSVPLEDILRRYDGLARTPEAVGAAVHVWPETATAETWEARPGLSAAVRRLAASTGAAQLVGTVRRDDAGRWYNAVVLVSADGERGAVTKSHLVPFGEYVPRWFRRLVPLARKLTEGMVDFTPGAPPAVLDLPGGPRVGILVCYEANFAGLAAAQVRAGAEVLINVTNDAWYRRTAATAQHALGPVSRAVELGRWVVRCANTGVSLLAGPDGRVHAPLGWFTPGVVAGEVEPRRDVTPYARWGEWPLAAVLLAALVL